MDYQELQKYNVVSMQTWCSTEAPRIEGALPKLLPNHNGGMIRNPLARIDFKGKVQMGLIEAKIHGVIKLIERGIAKNEKHCVNFVPLLSIAWIQKFKTVSPYLVKEAKDLFRKTDLLIFPMREDPLGRRGGTSWFAKSKDTKVTEQSKESIIADLVYDNNIDIISINKFLEIAQGKKLWSK